MAEYKVTITVELTVESDLSAAEIEQNLDDELYVDFSRQNVTGVQIENDNLESVEVWQRITHK
jgi:hypothetical protein